MVGGMDMADARPRMRYAPAMKIDSWRLLIDRPMKGARNMARDLAILDSVIAGGQPPTLRFYTWSPPCLSLGRHQGIDAVDFDFCRNHGIDIVRRPTGGRAVLHHLELTYSLVAPLGSGAMPIRVQEAYALICGVLVRAFRDLRINAQLSEAEFSRTLPAPNSNIPCFQAPAGGEILVRGRKLVGSALRLRGKHVLQHGSILLDWDEKLQAGAMGVIDPTGLSASVISLRELLGVSPPQGDLIERFSTAFSEEFGLDLNAAELTRDEEMRVEKIERETGAVR